MFDVPSEQPGMDSYLRCMHACTDLSEREIVMLDKLDSAMHEIELLTREIALLQRTLEGAS